MHKVLNKILFFKEKYKNNNYNTVCVNISARRLECSVKY